LRGRHPQGDYEMTDKGKIIKFSSPEIPDNSKGKR
jgi:hypothetical protein